MKARFLIPFVIFIALIAVFYKGLSLDPRLVPSPFVGKPMPQFELARLSDAEAKFSHKDILGKVTIFNVWASWCISCRVEHPILVEMAKRDGVRIVGLNYKEVRGDGGLDQLKVAKLAPEEELRIARERARLWLKQHGGDPYIASVMDLDGRVGIDYGVYGVPESFVVDKKGIIRYKHTGPISWDDYQKTIKPLLAELEVEQG